MGEPLVGPAFGSYPAADVTWLLADLSHVRLEAEVELREAAIQSGAAHYSESLPIEFRPTAAYVDLYREALALNARRVASYVAVLLHRILEERTGTPVLVSLARAGTPVGVLLRRYAATLGLDLPHYTMSIVRGRGIDLEALAYLAARHDPRDLVFVDGWTGKGAIVRELTTSVAAAAAALDVELNAELAVLADPGSCTALHGTRDDFLIPSACLNSTISGLVSRTVLNETLRGPGDFHGAKFYRELADADVSLDYVAAVERHFPDVAEDAALEATRTPRDEREPTWSGWAAVEQICADRGVDDVNLVKPGVGETTRVLLRRVPDLVLVRPGREAELGHVLHLAADRGVPVEVVDDLAFSCVGLIRATGSQGSEG